MSVLYFILIGLLAGWIAGQLMQGSGFGLVGNLVIGVVGAVIGGFIFRLLGVVPFGLIGELLMAVIGAMVLLYLISLAKKKG